jgi:hypothetical protein
MHAEHVVNFFAQSKQDIPKEDKYKNRIGGLQMVSKPIIIFIYF